MAGKKLQIYFKIYTAGRIINCESRSHAANALDSICCLQQSDGTHLTVSTGIGSGLVEENANRIKELAARAIGRMADLFIGIVSSLEVIRSASSQCYKTAN